MNGTWQETEFQYITCYSLSLSSFHCSSPFHRFNTSHVTLYRTTKALLSSANPVSIHHMLLFIIYETGEVDSFSRFQYITCYSLSLYYQFDWRVNDSFNTSHVTLYRRPGGLREHGIVVSIHHMLLFILKGYPDGCCFSEFQYITCYSLS